MKNKDGKMLSPCIISWAKFALNIKSDKPKNSKKCSIAYWRDTIDTILSKPEYAGYLSNRELAIERYHYVSRI